MVSRIANAEMFAALRYRDFRHMWTANAAAQAAAWALIVARGWIVFDKTGSTFAVGAVTFAAMGPMVIIPPFAGVLADRIDRRRILGWTYALNFGHNLTLAMLATFGVLGFWPLLALSLVNGVARSAQLPTSQALAANLVPKERLLNALSLNAATQHGSRLIGPGLVTPMIAAAGETGVAVAFFACTVFYAIGWDQIRRIEARSVTRRKAGESFWQNFTDGISYAVSQPIIRLVVILVFFHCGLTMAYESLLPGFAHHHLDAQSSGFGALMMGIGAGSFVGSIIIAAVAEPKSRGWLMLSAGILSGACQVVMSFAPSLPLAVGAAAMMGAAQTAFMTSGQALTQSIAADEYRGRIASLNAMSLGGVMSMMNLINGAMGTVTSAHLLLYAEGMLFVFIMVCSLLATTPRRIYVTGVALEAAPA